MYIPTGTRVNPVAPPPVISRHDGVFSARLPLYIYIYTYIHTYMYTSLT